MDRVAGKNQSHNNVLRTQGEQVSFPDGAEGFLCGVCYGIVDIVAMMSHPNCIIHEDYLTLPLGADIADQLPLEGIKWLCRLRPLHSLLVQADNSV